MYRAVLVGLTGIGASRPANPEGIPLFGAMPPSHAAAYHQHPHTELVGACDLRQEALDKFGSDWSDIWPDAGTYTDFGEMLRQQSPDLVSIAPTPTSVCWPPSPAPRRSFAKSPSPRRWPTPIV